METEVNQSGEPESSKTYVFYHSKDYDGIASGEVCRYFLNKQGIEPIMIGFDYGETLTATPNANDTVYLVDLSAKELMDHPNLIWIDHHISAIMEYGQRLPLGYRIDGVAACRLCWQWFTENKNLPSKYHYVERHVMEPYLLTLLGEYDIWDKHDSNAEYLQLGLKKAEKDFDFQKFFRDYDENRNNNFDRILELCGDGRTIQQYLEARDAELMQTMAFDRSFEGLRVKCYNGRGNSITFKIFDENDDVDCYCMFYFNGNRYKYSLYHHPKHTDYDLSMIAKKYGGGGHKGACGFETENLIL